jgi:hypothetical protein
VAAGAVKPRAATATATLAAKPDEKPAETSDMPSALAYEELHAEEPYVESAADGPHEAEEQHTEETHIEETPSHEETEEAHIELSETPSHEEQPEASNVSAANASQDPRPVSDTEEEVQALPESPSPAKGSDIENLVNMLESGMPSPIKLSMPEDIAAEIPDEE